MQEMKVVIWFESSFQVPSHLQEFHSGFDCEESTTTLDLLVDTRVGFLLAKMATSKHWFFRFLSIALQL